MKIAKILLLLAANITCCVMACAQSPAESDGKIQGSIYDPTGEAVIPAMKVIVEGGGVRREVTTNENGEYEFDLPAVLYSITTDTRQGMWYPLKRAAFRVGVNTTSVINLYVVEYRHAKLTYGVLTITAEILRFDRKTFRIEASGNVLPDDNGQRRRASSLGYNLRKES
jgi:hypothetical protein